ncbi:MAG TPA: serine hydrolase [Blastocatellia bacterium]|nr:serine hydrolase [Blastocatellia bacterium]
MFHIKSTFIRLALCLALLAPNAGLAQSPSTNPVALSAATRNEVIEGAIKALNEAYVFPDVAQKMEQAIRGKVQQKEYDGITDAAEFARKLTTHLQEISHDKHLRVFLNDGSRFGATPQQQNQMAIKRNFGFEKAERLSGNIGYLDLRGFEPANQASETATAAMNFLANTDALIFDLRQNGGGDPAMVAFLSSYLFENRTHLNSIYSRPTDKTEEFWTRETVPGKKFGNKPVFVLTSNRTFSAAEEFTYNLQNLKRATIIGETTGGGAHPVQPRKLGNQFTITVPFARSINPISKTNWEGTGVKPDVAVPADKALKVGHLAALKAVLATISDARLIEQTNGLIASLQKEVGEISLPEATQSAQPAKTQSAPAPTPSQEVKLPDTPAGKTFGEFLKAFNTGDLATLKQFHKAHGNPEDNAEQDLGAFNQTGALSLHSIASSTNTEISVIVKGSKGDRWLKFTFGVDANAPHAITDIRVQPTQAPATTAPAQTTSKQTAFAWPETPAGKTLSKFLVALNSGNLPTMKQFHKDTGGDEANANEDLEFYQQTGGLTPHSVTQSNEYDIEILAQAKKEGNWLKFGIVIGTKPPHEVMELRVNEASAPEGNPSLIKQTNANLQPRTESSAGKNEAEFLQALPAWLDRQSAEDQFSGAVLIAKKDKAIFQKAVGLADKTTQTPNRVDTKFNLGSINKIFTQIAITQLIEQGKLSWEDKLGKLLPDYPNKEAAEKVTLKHLYEMQSGIGDFFGKKYEATPKDRIRTINDYLPLFADQPLAFEPGTNRVYSNGGYIVLGAIIEKVTGQTYYDYVREHIYKPAGMTNTDSFFSGAKTPNLAEGYRRNEKGERVNNVDTRPGRGSSAGGGYSTTEDLLKFANALRENKLLNPQNSRRILGRAAVAGGAPGINAELEIAPEYTIIVLGNYDPPNAANVSRYIRSQLMPNSN